MSLMNDAPPAVFAGMTSPPSGTPGADIFKTEKVSWFKEVLALEPGSKIFLPYSRLLAETGETAEAMRVLRAGLERHPEFTEARLFLINLLHQNGDNNACGAEVARLAGLFREYPDFWDAWSKFSVSQGERGDLSVSLGVLAALFRDKSITLVDVLASGLRAMQDQGPFSAPAAVPAQAAPVAEHPQKASASSFVPLAGETEWEAASPEAFDAEGEEGDAVEFSGESEDVFGADIVPPFVFGADAPSENKVPAPVEEKCSLHTRSMAEVLAEQGDLRGAIEIYEDLLTAADPEDAAELQGRLENLKTKLGEASMTAPARVVTASSSGSAPSKTTGAKPQNSVLDLLEKLALRLESKSRQ